MFSIVVAIDRDSGIGKNGGIPWHIPSELKEFQALTTSGVTNIVIMGRNTWESLPKKPLPKRFNFIVSTTMTSHFHNSIEEYSVFNNLEQALSATRQINSNAHVYVIGGQRLYMESLEHPMCKKAYVTHIKASFGCDTLFPLDVLHRNYVLGSQGQTHAYNGVEYVVMQYEKFDKNTV
jgi:dihydrofolate reductase